MQDFARPYAYPHSPDEKRDIVDLDNPPPGPEAELPCVQAMEFLADVWEAEGAAEAKTAPASAREKTEKAVEVRALASNGRFLGLNIDGMW